METRGRCGALEGEACRAAVWGRLTGTFEVPPPGGSLEIRPRVFWLESLDLSLLVLTLRKRRAMHNEFSAVVERDGGWFVAYCPEIPGANGQGKTKVACLKSLSEAIDLILEDRRDDAFRGLPASAMRELVAVG